MEELNQTLTQEEGLFDDVEDFDTSDEDLTTTDEEVESNEEIPTSQAETETSNADPFVTIRYNKEDRNLSKDETISLAQKGMNYDKMYGHYSELNQTLNALASKNGMSVPEYLNSLQELQTRFEMTNELNRLKEAYPNTDENVLQELAMASLNSKETQRIDPKRAELERQVDIFERQYPGVNWGELPNEVYDLMNEGYTLLEAYQLNARTQEIAKQKTIEKQNQIEQKNLLNRQKSLGNVTNASIDDSDDFMKGFLDD